MEHTFEHALTIEKPSSEDHAWSYKMACDACLSEIEKRHGVDWKVTDVVFEDLGRETSTNIIWTGERTWKCTHRVKAMYNAVHRGQLERSTSSAIIEEQLNITFRMINVNHH